MNFAILVSVIAVLCFVLSVAERDVRGRIFNGQDAIRGQFKFVAALVLDKKSSGLRSEEFLCGGTIIAPRWVLTAAHCLDGISKVSVYLGALTVDDAEIAYEVRKNEFVSHPHWDDVRKINDIALIHIPTTRECSRIAFAQLPFQWASNPAYMLTDMIGITIGWGQRGDIGPFSDRLQWTRLGIMSMHECKHFCNDVTEEDICGKPIKPYGSPCIGDSGGPLLLQDTNEQIGIISISLAESCEDDTPVIFARVSQYLSWITEIIGI